MTDYIEQMMETAGVKKWEHFRQYNYAQVPYGKENLKNSQDNGIECIRIRNCTDENNMCIYWMELLYPKFTPEKQLELIKLIADSDNGAGGIGIFKIADDYYCTPECYWQIGKRATTNTDFVQALAQLTTELMKAGELDKEKVREILQ